MRTQASESTGFEVDVDVHRASWTQNDHDHADELEVEIPTSKPASTRAFHLAGTAVQCGLDARRQARSENFRDFASLEV